MHTLGSRIREARKERGLTQEALGEKAGIQKSAVAKYENGRIETANAAVIRRFADALGVTEDYLRCTLIHDLEGRGVTVSEGPEGAVCTDSVTDGTVRYDEIEDPLPFDINAPVIEIGDDDYAIWYRDVSEEPKKYEDKLDRFKCHYLKRKRAPEGSFIVGRHLMACCADDIPFAGLICKWENSDSIVGDSWHILTARMNYKFSRAYGRKGPVLTFVSDEECQPPENPVASFY